MLVKINSDTPELANSLDFIKEKIQIGTNSKAAFFAVMAYPSHIEQIERLKKQVDELNRENQYLKTDLNDIKSAVNVLSSLGD